MEWREKPEVRYWRFFSRHHSTQTGSEKRFGKIHNFSSLWINSDGSNSQVRFLNNKQYTSCYRNQFISLRGRRWSYVERELEGHTRGRARASWRGTREVGHMRVGGTHAREETRVVRKRKRTLSPFFSPRASLRSRAPLQLAHYITPAPATRAK